MHWILYLYIDSFTPGRRTGSSFFQILYQKCQQNMVLLSIVDVQKICISTKFGRCSSKIEPATPNLLLKFKRACQTQFFSHTLQILVNDRFLIGHQMIFYSFFCVSIRKAEIWEKLLFPFLSSPQVVIIVHNHGIFYHLGATRGKEKVGILKFQLSC